MHLLRAVLAAVAAGCLPIGQALAQEAPPAAEAVDAADPDKIVVTGRNEEPPSGTQVMRQARQVTQGGDLRHTPLARFEDRLCPGIMGLKPNAAMMMIDRIRQNAEKLDMWMAEGNCRPNLIVAFVEDGRADMQKIADNAGWLLDTMSLSERRELLTEDGPVRVWTTVVQATRDGMPVPRNTGGSPPVVSMWMAHSRIYVPIRNEIASVVVLFDKSGVRGKTLVQLADYATMRGLARTRPVDSDGQPMDTILSLFDADASPPMELTDFDRAYLASLYDGIPNIPGITKVLGVNRQLRKQAAAEETGEP